MGEGWDNPPFFNLEEVSMDYITLAKELRKIASMMIKEKKIKDAYIKVLEKRAAYWMDVANNNNNPFLNPAVLTGTGVLGALLFRDALLNMGRYAGKALYDVTVKPTYWTAQGLANAWHKAKRTWKFTNIYTDYPNFRKHLSDYLVMSRKGPYKIPYEFGLPKAFSTLENTLKASTPGSKLLRWGLLGAGVGALYNMTTGGNHNGSS